MAEGVGSRKKLKSDSSSRSSNAISWQSWAEKYSISPETGTKDQTTDVVKIFAKDVGLYGLSPRYEDICLVVCKVCKQIYKMQALYGHYERRHAERLSQVLHQTMSSRKDYYGSSSCNTSLAHPSSALPSVHPSQKSPAHKIKPPESSFDPKDQEERLLKQKFKPAEKFVHPHKISNQEITSCATSSSIPNLKPEFAKQTLISTGSKKPSAFHFPGFIARKSMSNIFPSEKSSELCRSDPSLNSANSSRIISQTVSVKKTTLDSTSVYDFDDLTTGKQADHNKSSLKNKSKDHNLPKKSEVKSEKSSFNKTNDKNSSILSSKVFKTPEQISSKNCVHPSVSPTETGHKDVTINKKKYDSKSSENSSNKLGFATPSHKSSSEKTFKFSQPSEVYHKIGIEEERVSSSLKPSSHVHSPKKSKHNMNSPLNIVKDIKKLNSSSKVKKRVDNIYSSSSPSSISASSSRCSSPQKLEINNTTITSLHISSSSCKTVDVSNNHVNQKNKKLSEMSKRDLLLNAKKSTKVKMSPKIENGISNRSTLLGLSSDEDSSKQFIEKSMSNHKISNSSIAEEYKKASKSRHSIVSNSDSSDSEQLSGPKNCRSSKPSSLQPKNIISHVEESEVKFNKMSPKVSLDSFPSSGSRKRRFSSEDEFSSSERNLKKQKTSAKTSLKIHSTSETSPLANIKTLINHSDIITKNITNSKMSMCSIKSQPVKEKKVERKDSIPPERRHQLQHGSRLHSFPSPSSSSEPVDSLDSPLSKSSIFPTSKHHNKHITGSMDNIQYETSPVVYQPDIHCGVFINSNFPCMNSLSCQEHSISLRRAVGGRSKAFDLLLLSQTSKPKHPPTVMSSSSYSIPSPPPSYINPKLAFNISNSFSHVDERTVPEEERSRLKSKKPIRSLSSSSPSASPPNSRVRNSTKRKYSPKSAFLSKDSTLTEEVIGQPCKTKMNANPEQMHTKMISSLDEGEHLKDLGMELDEENKELIENLIKDSEDDNNNGAGLCLDGDYDNDDEDDEALKTFSVRHCDSLLRPSLLGKKDSERHFERPKKLSTHRQEHPVNLIGSEMLRSSTSQPIRDISEFLDHHPKPVAVNSFGAWNLSSSVLSGMYVLNRRHDFLRQTLNKVVSKVNKTGPDLRTQNHPWRRKSLNFQMRINSCHLREVPTPCNTCSSNHLEEDESEGDDFLEKDRNLSFRNLAPPTSFLKAFQTSHQKKSNHATCKPFTSTNRNQCSSNQRKGPFSILQSIESSQTSKIDEKSQSIPCAKSPPHKKQILDAPHVSSTEVVAMVSSCVSSITNHQENLHSSHQNIATKKSLITSNNASQALKDERSGDFIKFSSENPSSTSNERDRYSCKLLSNPDTNPSTKLRQSASNGIPKNIKFPVLTPSKFQHNGYVSSLSDHYLHPPAVLNNSSFRNSFIQPTVDIVSPSIKSSQTSAKSLPVRTITSPLNGASFPPNIIPFDNNNTNLILNYYTPSPNTLNSVDRESRLHKVTCFKNEEDSSMISKKELYSEHQLIPEHARGNSPDDKQQECSKSSNIVRNRQPNNIPHYVTNGNFSTTINLSNPVNNVQIPFVNNFVHHNRHHIMNIIGSSMLPNQNNQLAQEPTIFHKSNQDNIASNELDKIQQPANQPRKAMIGT